MVRFQPPVDLAVDSDSGSSSGGENDQRRHSQQQQRAKHNARREDDSASSEEDEDAIQLPLRGRAPAVARERAEDARTTLSFGGSGRGVDQQDEAEMKYPRSFAPARSVVDTAHQRKLHLMDQVLMDDEEEAFVRAREDQEAMDEEEEEQAEPEEPQPRGHFTQQQRKRVQAPAPPRSALKSFLAGVPSYVRPSTVGDYFPGNPLVAAAASPSASASAPAAKRSVLSFMQHSYRAAWSHNGSSLFFAGGIDGRCVERLDLDPLAVDLAAQDALTSSSVDVQSKKLLAQTALETHLAFHSQPTPALPSSAKVFGAASSFGFAPPAAANQLTPFTRLCDAHIAALRTLQAPSFGGPRASPEEVQLALSTFQLMRVLYSTEEAEQRAPKLSRSAEQALRAERAIAASGDLSVVTAREDAYATMVGRESAFEQGWLQPSVTASYVQPRVNQLQQEQRAGAKGADKVSGTLMQQVLAYLIGHDLVAATTACIAAGNFRLATLLPQLDSFNYSGRLQADGRPLLESSQHDFARQLAAWVSKDRGMGAYIPSDVETIYRLMSGDVLIEPSLTWIESLALHYWYTQPKAEHTNVHRAMLGFKKSAFMDARAQVRKPFPAYASYVPVAQRRGGVAGVSVSPSRGVLEDDDDAMEDGPSQALVVSTARSGTEYYDLRYGLLDLYTEQSRSLATVLSPQTHVPHVLDHQLAWHVFTTLQTTPLSQFGPRLHAFHMSFIHQLELLDAAAGDQDDFWKYAIYVALAAPFPPQAEFDREKIVKTILLRHVAFARDAPFALHVANSGLPATLPVLKVDASTDLFSMALVHAEVAAPAVAASAVESFLLNRCHVPSRWLYECKAVSAAYEHEYAVACFYYLHAGQVHEAYSIFHAHMMHLWALVVVNTAEQTHAGADSPIETALLALLQVFLPHAATLYGWSTCGGGLLLSYLEFRRDFASNLRHFTAASIHTSATSLRDRARRFDTFDAYKRELQTFLRQVDQLAATANDLSNADGVPASLPRLCWSKLSGAVLRQLHALQPIEDELASERRAGGDESIVPAALSAEAVVLSGGDLVSAADRLAILTDWKDQWLQTYA